MTSPQYEPRGLQGPKSLTETSTSSDPFSDFMVISNSNFSDLSAASPDWKAMEEVPVEEVIRGCRNTHEKLMDLTKKYKDLVTEYTKKCETLQSKANEIKSKDEEVRSLREKLDEQTNQTPVLLSPSLLDAESTEDQPSLKCSPLELEALFKMREEHENYCDNIEEIKRELLDLRKIRQKHDTDCHKLQQELDSKKKLFERIASSQTKLREDNQKVISECDAIRAEHKDVVQELNETRQELKQAKAELNPLKEQLEKEKDEKSVLEDELKTQGDELDKCKREFYKINNFSKEEIISAMKKMKDTIASLRAKSENQLNEIGRKKETITQLKQKNDELTRQLAERGRNPSPQLEPEPPVVEQGHVSRAIPVGKFYPAESLSPAGTYTGSRPSAASSISQSTELNTQPPAYTPLLLSYATGGGNSLQKELTCFFCPFKTYNGGQLEQHINDAHPE